MWAWEAQWVVRWRLSDLGLFSPLDSISPLEPFLKVFTVVINMVSKSSLGRNLFHLITPWLRKFRSEIQGRTWSRGHGGTVPTNLPWWLAQPALYSSGHLPRGGAAPSELAHPHYSLTKKIHYRPTLSQLRFLFPDNSSLCKVIQKKKKPKTQQDKLQGFFSRHCLFSSGREKSQSQVFLGMIFFG